MFYLPRLLAYLWHEGVITKLLFSHTTLSPGNESQCNWVKSVVVSPFRDGELLLLWRGISIVQELAATSMNVWPHSSLRLQHFSSTRSYAFPHPRSPRILAGALLCPIALSVSADMSGCSLGRKSIQDADYWPLRASCFRMRA